MKAQTAIAGKYLATGLIGFAVQTSEKKHPLEACAESACAVPHALLHATTT